MVESAAEVAAEEHEQGGNVKRVHNEALQSKAEGRGQNNGGRVYGPNARHEEKTRRRANGLECIWARLSYKGP